MPRKNGTIVFPSSSSVDIYIYVMTLKGQREDLISGQGRVEIKVTQIGKCCTYISRIVLARRIF